MTHAAAVVPRGQHLLSPRAARLLQEIAAQQAARADRIAATMFAAYAEEIPSYAQIVDPALREDVEAVSAAMVRAWLDVMSSAGPTHPEALQPLLQGARRRAAQGIDLYSMLRAYRVGIRVMWSELVSTPEWQSHALQGAVATLAEWALDFADRVSTEVAAVYLDELARVTRQREHRRSALLNVILAGPGGESVEGPKELERPHTVVVGRVAEDLQLDRLESAGALVENAVEAVLWTVRHRSVIAAVPLHAGMTRAELARRLGGLLPADGIVAFGVGGNARGARETRQSYSEAVDSLRVGPVLAGAGAAVFDYQELAPAIALLQRPDQARRFVATALEPLGDMCDRPWVLPTLEAYITRQGRIKEAATQLGVHLNTVKYRLRELRAATGALLADGDRAATLLLALKLRRLLGEGDQA
jgi:DNA-binding PucR family transcriptional regulator